MNGEELNRAVAEIQEEDRRTIARWLLTRAERYQPSMMLSAFEAMRLRDVLTGAAVDVMDPTSEDMTNAHAARIIGALCA